jgi:AraC-like DNA-binding protein
MSRQTADRREKTSLILHCLLTAGTLGEALQLYGRFARVLWGGQSIVEVRITPAHAEIIFGTTRKAGVTGLVHEMWALARIVSELEWLVQAELKCLGGRVRQPATIDPAIATLFFAHPLTFGSSDLALLVPSSLLGLPVVAVAQDVEAFCLSLPLSTLTPVARRRSAGFLVREILRREVLSGRGRSVTQRHLASLLGHSTATLNRILRSEGTTFKTIRSEVVSAIACQWLASTDLGIEEIAVRLGYSDGFAFRRWFQQTHGCAPFTYRKQARAR